VNQAPKGISEEDEQERGRGIKIRSCADCLTFTLLYYQKIDGGFGSVNVDFCHRHTFNYCPS
jgi:hypothetical protein